MGFGIGLFPSCFKSPIFPKSFLKPFLKVLYLLKSVILYSSLSFPLGENWLLSYLVIVFWEPKFEIDL